MPCPDADVTVQVFACLEIRDGKPVALRVSGAGDMLDFLVRIDRPDGSGHWDNDGWLNNADEPGWDESLVAVASAMAAMSGEELAEVPVNPPLT